MHVCIIAISPSASRIHGKREESDKREKEGNIYRTMGRSWREILGRWELQRGEGNYAHIWSLYRLDTRTILYKNGMPVLSEKHGEVLVAILMLRSSFSSRTSTYRSERPLLRCGSPWQCHGAFAQV
ncbi:hypothetical protein Salat_2793900 [Sesamum alatum]|uniref:Uncharacterized protein n=1 Tax=Sesamum alatum TaxID=300844 RepID=A0AAE2C9E8_9LAMI|nr:hypothetical protein Salat_2793900 [Sesamum alatum]